MKRRAAIKMISPIVIILLLGVSAVFSAGPSCSDLQKKLLQAGNLRFVNYTTVKSENFGNSVEIIRQSSIMPTVQTHIFSVEESEEINLPQVIAEGTPYKIDSLVTTILDQTGATAVLGVKFTSDKSDEPSKDVVFLIVPLIAVVENDPNLNAVLNSILHNLGTTPKKGIHTDTFEWLQPLLSQVADCNTTLEKEESSVFMTDCQNVVIDERLMADF